MSNLCKSKGCGPQRETCGSPKANIAIQDLIIKSTLGRMTHKIMVMSGKGGVGKSTVAANLALGLSRMGYKIGLMDVDLHGADIFRMLGISETLKSGKKQGLIPASDGGENLKVMSLDYLMPNRDDAIIWRGPLKMQAIRQFIADVDWGELDYLIIDAPPGTGDEPLTVAQLIKDGHALIVTTPQEVALADVRKSIMFCRQLKMEIVGLVENMSGFVCPHCQQPVEIFKTGGGERTAQEFGIPFLGRIPLDPRVVLGGDDGTPYLVSQEDALAVKSFSLVLEAVVSALPSRGNKERGQAI